MIIKTVTGLGYGDEGKGLATDYFCRQLGDRKILNVKVNGGAQAGHTVCALDESGYKHWVFKQYGSGTFAGADTYLLDTFMVNIYELLKERQALKEIYNINTKLYIDRKCRITLPIDIVLNRFIEDKRTNKHGSCGLGIYETFHRNNEYKSITVQDIIRLFCRLNLRDFEKELEIICNGYSYIRFLEFEKEDIIVTDEDKQYIKEQTQKFTKQFIEALADIAKADDIKFTNGIDELLINYKYMGLVYECSQGLELDQFEKRNWPHLTPSSTGLINVRDSLVKSACLNKYTVEDIETCFITRSYKTKHGAGPFIEEDTELQSKYGLYDRTNSPNQYQGVLKYGKLSIGRMKLLMLKQLDELNIEDTKVSMMVTHLDQTNNGLETQSVRIDIGDLDIKSLGINYKLYMSYGEKASDIINKSI